MSWLFSSIKSLTDEMLMQHLLQGKKEAFDELYHRYSRKMHFFFYKMLQADREKADDFTQDLFLKLIEKPHLFKTEMRFSTWFYSIAGNMCRNEYRRLTVRNEEGNEVDLESLYFEQEISTTTIDLSQFKEALETELGKLSPEHRLIFHLRFQENLPLHEISVIANCPEGTVKSRLFYTLKKLSSQLSIYNPHL